MVDSKTTELGVLLHVEAAAERLTLIGCESAEATGL